MNLGTNQTTILYQRIYRQYMPSLLRFSLKFVSEEEAEDIVQDIFIKYWGKELHTFSDEEISRLLFTSVRNACIDHLRHKECQKTYLEKQALQLKLDELDYYQADDKQFIQEDLMWQIQQKIAKLPEQSQLIFRMAYIEGLKSAEISERLAISIRTVENQLYRSLQQLRKSCSNLFVFCISFL